MKKTALLILMISVVFSVSALGDFGYGLSVSGTQSAKTDVEIHAFYRPFEFDYCNPFLRAEGGIGFSNTSFGFSGVSAKVGFELVRSFWNPLCFVTVNKSLYSPSISFGTLYKNNTFDILAEVSPFRVLEKDFIYEYLAVALDFDKTGFKDYKVYLFRLTALL